MPASKPALLVALVAVGVVLGGVAAASLGGDDTSGQAVTTESSVVTTTIASDDDLVEDPGDAADLDGEEGDDAAAAERYWGEECGEGPPTNHGRYVAATPAGESRREAAHSPCGKPLAAVTVTSTTTATTLTPPTSESLSTGASGGNGNGNGRGNGGPPPGKGPKGR